MKAQVKDILHIFNNCDEFIEKGVTPIRGVLFWGEPGCGKTMLAKAMAKEAKVNFLCRSASDLIAGEDAFAGEQYSAAKIRELFEMARKQAPCIIFIDEIDMIAKDRMMGDSSGTTQLLAEMDGFANSDKILVVATANNLGMLDRALLRSGRFSRKYLVSVPTNNKDIKELVDMYKPDVEFDKELTEEKIINSFRGQSPANIKQILNEVASNSLLSGKPVSFRDIQRVTLELGISGTISVCDRNNTEKLLVARHEAGHALVAYALGDIPICVSTSSMNGKSNALGYTMLSGSIGQENGSEPNELKTIEDYKAHMAIMYGGLMAELHYANNDISKVTLGAAQDMSNVRKIAIGIAESMQYVPGKYWGNVISEVTGSEISIKYVENRDLSKRVEQLASGAKSLANDIISKNVKVLDDLSQIVYDRGELTGRDIVQFFDKYAIIR